MDHVYAVILAGGSGTRFWPKSRHLKPKQLCRMGNDPETMIEKTLRRLDGWIPKERRLIVTHCDQIPGTMPLVQKYCSLVLGEPIAKNTAPALMIAALEIQKMHRGPKPPIMVSLHADHLIQNETNFKKSIHSAVELAEKDLLTLIGVTPTYPETGYGYIEKSAPYPGIPSGYYVASFREKPDLDTAKEFVSSQRFLWNSGLFVWKIDTLLKELAVTLGSPLASLKALFDRHSRFGQIPPADIEATYEKLPKISIDHAVLETSKKVAVVSADMGWQDVGSWSALDLAFKPDDQGNLIFGDACALQTSGTTIDTDGPFVAALGLKDFVIVASKGAILVCPKDKAQDVKSVVDWLSSHHRKEFT